jgi:dTDP-4-amino-4,6-dideoxygalactose transaminase
MFVSKRRDLVERARYLSTQAREPFPHYEHVEVGYNYRMSNLLAAVGRGQLHSLDERIARRRENTRFYQDILGALPGLMFMPEATYGTTNGWLTCLTIDPSIFGASREDVRLNLETMNIESRPVWKPMHLQPVFAQCRCRGGDVAARLFERGLCLPSGSSLTAADRSRVVSGMLSTPGARIAQPEGAAPDAGMAVRQKVRTT